MAQSVQRRLERISRIWTDIAPSCKVVKLNLPSGFTPISLSQYVELHLRANPGTNRGELLAQLEYAIDAHRRGVRCECGAPIWIVGSAHGGLACFTCITLESVPDNEYEIAIESDSAA
jgi:hypothetical protein